MARVGLKVTEVHMASDAARIRCSSDVPRTPMCHARIRNCYCRRQACSRHLWHHNTQNKRHLGAHNRTCIRALRGEATLTKMAALIVTLLATVVAAKANGSSEEVMQGCAAATADVAMTALAALAAKVATLVKVEPKAACLQAKEGCLAAPEQW